MTTDRPFEHRLDELREEARRKGGVAGRGVDIAAGPIPAQPGYYGEPVVRPPVWTWEISTYFFVGGCGGMAGVIAAAALAFGHTEVTRAAMWMALVAAILSPVLLILDLGRPLLFFNMLRVFKPQSPMSVGSWIVAFFGLNASLGAIVTEIWQRQIFSDGGQTFIAIIAVLLVIGTAFWGMFLATYTGVLISATTIPAWFLHRRLLPIHFGTAGLGSAAGLLELLGYQMAPLFALSAAAAGVETILWLALEWNKHGPADRALHEGASGWKIRTAEFLCGPLALALRFAGFVPASALLFCVGAALSRFGWMEAGRVCGLDPEAIFASQKAGRRSAGQDTFVA
ncbi:MAG TPA: NrfD/PsrC family molybdoenzyme membrane anchor subunit [Chthoniobacterales bacterium]|nr:NrfD/PsrC family molybdoenzyme membrane anchor subunit [Chthoniobacterales bacterium]